MLSHTLVNVTMKTKKTIIAYTDTPTMKTGVAYKCNITVIALSGISSTWVIFS